MWWSSNWGSLPTLEPKQEDQKRIWNIQLDKSVTYPSPKIEQQQQKRRSQLWFFKMRRQRTIKTLHDALKELRPPSECLKITEKVSFNIASEASCVYILSGQKLIKIQKMSIFGEIWKHVPYDQTALPDGNSPDWWLKDYTIEFETTDVVLSLVPRKYLVPPILTWRQNEISDQFTLNWEYAVVMYGCIIDNDITNNFVSIEKHFYF